MHLYTVQCAVADHQGLGPAVDLRPIDRQERFDLSIGELCVAPVKQRSAIHVFACAHKGIPVTEKMLGTRDRAAFHHSSGVSGS